MLPNLVTDRQWNWRANSLRAKRPISTHQRTDATVSYEEKYVTDIIPPSARIWTNYCWNITNTRISVRSAISKCTRNNQSIFQCEMVILVADGINNLNPIVNKGKWNIRNKTWTRNIAFYSRKPWRGLIGRSRYKWNDNIKLNPNKYSWVCRLNLFSSGYGLISVSSECTSVP
jgi:hypothetical protein